jgi:hypothetical protein
LDSQKKIMIPTQIPISPLTLSLISGIHELKGALRTASHMAPERMLALRQVATLESVASGLRLGNVVLSDTEVRRVLAMRNAGGSRIVDRTADLTLADPNTGAAEQAVSGMNSPASGQSSPTAGHLLPLGSAALDDLIAEPLADHEVDELLLAHQTEAGVLNADEQQAVGYYEALSRVLALVPSGRLTEDDVNDLHRVLLGHSSKDAWHMGKYKVSANNPLITHPESGTATVLQSTPPANVGDQMAALLAWLTRERSEPTLHPLLTVTVFTASFMGMRPYQDGNGRMARLLARLLLPLLLWPHTTLRITLAAALAGCGTTTGERTGSGALLGAGTGAIDRFRQGEAVGVVGQADFTPQQVLQILAQRLRFMTGLPGWAHFSRGWARRIADLMQGVA